MRSLARTFILTVGFAVAIVAVRAEQNKPTVTVGNCFEITAPSAPSICK